MESARIIYRVVVITKGKERMVFFRGNKQDPASAGLSGVEVCLFAGLK